MKKSFLVLILLISSISYSQDINVFFEKADLFFNKYVSEGLIAYSKINDNPNDLNNLMLLAENISISKSDENTYKAFWINAYNLSVIKGLVDNYPTKSPLDNEGFFDKTKYSLGGMKITLNDVENKRLRAQFKDARFHFVLVCGALGCPLLINQAYLPKSLNEQMDIQTDIALNGSFIKVNVKKKRVEVSEIMKWYKEDFTRDGTSEIDFINRYREEKIPNNFKISYFSYNWNINKQ